MEPLFIVVVAVLCVVFWKEILGLVFLVLLMSSLAINCGWLDDGTEYGRVAKPVAIVQIHSVTPLTAPMWPPARLGDEGEE